MPTPADDTTATATVLHYEALGHEAGQEAVILQKVTRRLIPFLFLLYVANILDRANVSIAKLRMLDDLGMSEAAYGLGAGLFYLGYVVFEVPSNLILARVGARTWIARIAISWGVISSLMMFAQGPMSFYALRILLGVAEAGFFPGIILYLSQWFPARARARAVAKFMIAGLIATMVGNPVSGAILQYMDDVAGLEGWQWVFLLEGIPSVILGVIAFRYLTDRPELAHWLAPHEREWLVRRMDQEQGQLNKSEEQQQQSEQHGFEIVRPDTHPTGGEPRRVPGSDGGHWSRAMVDPRVWLLIAIYFTVAVGDNSYGFFLPALIQTHFPGLKGREFLVGLLAAIPSIVALVAMLAVAAHSDRTGERRWHIACSAFVAAAGWVLMAVAPSPWLFVVALVVTLAGMKSMLPTFWTLPTSMLGGTAAAAGIALINSVANLGGFFGPTAMGHIRESTNSYTNALLLVAAVLAAGGVLALCTRPARTPKKLPTPE